jgi:chemotaxis protein MotA
MPEEQRHLEIQFGDLAGLTDREIQLFLRKVDTRDLAVAMKDATQEINERIFSNVSDRVETMIRLEMDLSDVPPAHVRSVQDRVSQILQKLVQTGLIRYPGEPSPEEQRASRERRDRSIRECRERLEWLNQRGGKGPGISLSTIVGLFLGTLLVTWGIREGVALSHPGPAAGFVLLGAAAVALTAHDLRDAFGMGRLLTKTLFYRLPPVQVWIEYQILCLEGARRGGILSLKHVLDRIPDPFLRGGMELAVDGVEPNIVKKLLEEELSCMEERHRAGQAVMATAGVGGGLFGGIGLLLGLMSGHASGVTSGDIRAAMIPLLWGLIVGGVCYALRGRLQRRTAMEVHRRRMAIMSIFEIQHGTHPTMLRWALTRLVAPRWRPECLKPMQASA